MKTLLGKKTLLIAVMALLIGFLAACSSGGSSSGSGSSGGSGGSASEGAALSFSMGVQPWVGYAPWWIAAEKGIFQKYGLDVKVINFNQDADLNAAFASDNIRVANVATHTAMLMAGNNGLDLKGIVLMDESMQADAIIAAGNVRSVEDLKGREIAFEEGTTSDLLLRQALKDHNMSMDDVKPVYMAASDAGLALASGKVEVAVTYEPYITNVKAKAADLNVIYSGANSPGLISDIAVVKSEFLAEHPDLKEKLRQVWDETMEYWQNNKEEGDAIIAKNTGVDAAELPIILEGLSYFNSAKQAELADSGEFTETVKNIQNILLEQGSLEQEIDADAMFELK